jgi:hypothetical protein
MSRYASIRGWLEWYEDDLSDLKFFLENYNAEKEHNLNDYEIQLYKKGWNFPQSTFNWTSYVFYGGDIRIYGVSYFHELFSRIAAKFDDYDGYIQVNLEEETYELKWHIKAGVLTEEKVLLDEN